MPGTGDVYRYATITAPLAAAHGAQDVCLVSGGTARISTFALH